MTEVIARARGCGKTTELLRMMRDNPDSVFVAVNAHEADSARRMFLAKNRDIHPSSVKDRFVTFEWLLSQRDYGAIHETDTRTFLLDNAERALAGLFRGKLDAFSITARTVVD